MKRRATIYTLKYGDKLSSGECYLDQALRQYRDALIKNNLPIDIAIVPVLYCSQCDGSGLWYPNPEDSEDEQSCPKCKGCGLIQRWSI